MVVEPASVRRPWSSSAFSKTSPLKMPGRIFSYFTYSIYRWGNEYLCFLLRSDKNSGCYGNLKFPFTCIEKSGNWHYLLSGWGYLNFVFT